MKQNWPWVDGFGNRAMDKKGYYIFLTILYVFEILHNKKSVIDEKIYDPSYHCNANQIESGL